MRSTRAELVRSQAESPVFTGSTGAATVTLDISCGFEVVAYHCRRNEKEAGNETTKPLQKVSQAVKTRTHDVKRD
jgi:hypothetical protein